MIRKTALRSASFALMAAATASFSLTGFVVAETITNTGPNSRNKISSNHTNTCDLRTHNNVNVRVRNQQTAVSGDASVSGNTTVGSTWESLNPASWHGSYNDWFSGVMDWISNQGNNWNTENARGPSWTPSSGEGWKNNWSNWNPSLWRSNGQSYDNWHSKLLSHLSASASSWPTNWVGAGGGVSTGDAHNSSSSRFNVGIYTDNDCFPKKAAGGHTPGQGGGVVTKPKAPPKAPAPAAAPPSTGGGAGVGGGQGGGFGGGGGVGHAKPHAPKPQHPAPGGQGAGPNAPKSKENVISKTGPDSVNKISNNVSNNVTSRTTNNVSISNTNTQHAQSGNANVRHNTSAGASTGDAANNNGTGAGVGLKATN